MRLKSLLSFGMKKKVIPIPVLTNEKQLLKGKVALITGGSGGIGMAIATEFLNSGASVIIAGTSESKLKNIVCSMGNNKLKYIVLNLMKTEEFSKKIEEAAESVKEDGCINILVNCAGIHSSNSIQDFFEYTEQEYDEIMNINLKGTYFFTREMSKYMIKNNIQGHILNISSTTALEPAWSPYRLSKHGINELTKGLADRLYEFGIIVNGIAPCSTATQMIGYQKGESIYTSNVPAHRMVMPEEIAAYAKLMVSDLGNMVIGETLYISGGRGNIYFPTYINSKKSKE